MGFAIGPKMFVWRSHIQTAVDFQFQESYFDNAD